jgi:hypothetical protein
MCALALGLGLGLCGGAGASATPELASVSPDLGDTLGGAPITLTGINLTGTTGVTIGGTACTSVTVVNATTVTCKTPAKAAGSYDVVITTAAGSDTLVAGFESWSPLVDYAAARVFQSDSGLTAATSTTRCRAGKYLAEMYPDTIARDGTAVVRLSSGRLLMLGGWHTAGWGASPAGDITNAVLASDNDGATWTELQARVADPPTSGASARFKPGHNAGVTLHTHSGTLYVYWIGTDANAGASRDGGVWRATAASLDVGGTPLWERISTAAPTADRSLFGVASYGGNLYVLGGQLTLSDEGSASNDVYRSTDGGVTWTQLADAPWTGRTVFDPVVFGGFLWVISGGVYGASNIRYEDVWKFDGTTWTEVLAEGHSQFDGRIYHTNLVFDGRMWMINGVTSAGGNGVAQVHSSADGATWTAAQMTIPWAGTHAQSAFVDANSDGIKLTLGIIDGSIWKLVEHAGTLVSQWVDRGSDAITIVNATDAQKPILDATTFPSSVPGVVFRDVQRLVKAGTPDRAIAGGVMETWIVGRSLNTDAASENSSAFFGSTVVGNTHAEAYNTPIGFHGDQLASNDGAISWRRHLVGSALCDDRPRLHGTEHQTGSLKLFTGTSQTGTTKTDVGFDTTYTGWNAIGAAINDLDFAKMYALGAVVILKTNAPSSGTFRTKLNKWAKKWGSVT